MKLRVRLGWRCEWRLERRIGLSLQQEMFRSRKKCVLKARFIRNPAEALWDLSEKFWCVSMVRDQTLRPASGLRNGCLANSILLTGGQDNE